MTLGKSASGFFVFFFCLIHKIRIQSAQIHIYGATGMQTLLVGIWNDAATLENCSTVSFNVEHKSILWPSSSTPGSLPKRNGNMSIKRVEQDCTCWWERGTKRI